MNPSNSPIAFLFFLLEHFDLKILNQSGKLIQLESDYTIEIEGDHLFKLMQGGQVIAPFNQVEELCQFIKQDMQLNE